MNAFETRRYQTDLRQRVTRSAQRTVIVLALLITGCAALPPRPELPDTYASPPAGSGEISALASRFKAKHGAGLSGFHLLPDARESLLARLALVDLAQTSIDIQYFIWQDDATGNLLFDRLLRAADRGVRVRILVDDLALAAKSRDLAIFSSHPNLDIRLFNPNPSRDNAGGWAFQFLASFKELNRRMHNKLLIVDGHVAVIGGRNIGNEYFGLSTQYNFLDVDVLMLGAVIEEAAHAFDDYWNQEIAFPASAWGTDFDAKALAALRGEVEEDIDDSRELLQSYPLQPLPWTHWLAAIEADLKTGTAHLLQDDPIEIDGQDYRLVDMIDYIAAPAQQEVLLSSPYLIPVSGFLEEVRAEVDKGVSMRLLTGSLGSNNHTAAHSHYKKYRTRILATGAKLYEFHHEPPPEIRAQSDVPPIRAQFISLHAKVIVADRRLSFIGSLNFDPRAIDINTENGLLIESAELGEQLAALLDKLMSPEVAWQVLLDENGALRWESAQGAVTSQPARSGGQRVSDFFFRLLPIESQL
jgi:putative cardiolipin synthase